MTDSAVSDPDLHYLPMSLSAALNMNRLITYIVYESAYNNFKTKDILLVCFWWRL